MTDDFLIAFGVFSAINIAAASGGGIFKPGAWYESLNRPPWTPPNWAFPVVWFAIFLLNALSGAIAWVAHAPGDIFPFAVYGVSLVINFAWSALFFGAKRMDWSLIDVALLWLSIVAVIWFFTPISLPAAALQLPYLAWVSLAATLNLRMLQMNPRPA